MQNTKIIDHLQEIRKRLLHCLSAVGLVFLCLFAFKDQLFHSLALPLLQHLPNTSSLIATNITSPLFIPIKFALYLSFFLMVPFVLFQLWRFIAPGLYQTERKLVWLTCVSSVLLFYLGVGFCYFIVFPLIFGFFTSVAPEGVTVMPDISQYLDFTMKLFFAFGFSFEIPVLILLLISAGITTVDQLKSLRPYVVVGAFIIGMLLTPPDVLSQLLLAVPICLLFEVGLLFSKIMIKNSNESVDKIDITQN